MTADAPEHRLPAQPATADDLAGIPILLEPVAEAPTPPAAIDVPQPRTLGRADQQSLFDDPAGPPPVPARAPARRAGPTPEKIRAAGHLLNARAPAIIDEVVAAHTARIGEELRRRLQAELASLLAEMSGDAVPPADSTGHDA